MGWSAVCDCGIFLKKNRLLKGLNPQMSYVRLALQRLTLQNDAQVACIATPDAAVHLYRGSILTMFVCRIMIFLSICSSENIQRKYEKSTL